MGKVNWTAEHLAVLVEKYPSQGTEIPELLEVFSRGSIRARASKLGISTEKLRTWDDSSIAVLKEYYPIYGSQIPALLEKGYSANAIRCQARIFGLLSGKRSSPVKWTAEMIDLLKENYAMLGTNIVELTNMGVGRESIRRKATELGLERDGANLGGYGKIAYNGVAYKSLRAACQQAGIPYITVQCAIKRDAFPGLSAQEVFDGYVSGSLKNITAGDVNDAVAVSFAYTGCDGQDYYCIRCAVCRSVCIMPKHILRSFAHGDLCQQYVVPAGIRVPNTVQYHK